MIPCKGLTFTCRTESDLKGTKYETNIHMTHLFTHWAYPRTQARAVVHPGQITRLTYGYMNHCLLNHPKWCFVTHQDTFRELHTDFTPRFKEQTHPQCCKGSHTDRAVKSVQNRSHKIWPVVTLDAPHLLSRPLRCKVPAEPARTLCAAEDLHSSLSFNVSSDTSSLHLKGH